VRTLKVDIFNTTHNFTSRKFSSLSLSLLFIYKILNNILAASLRNKIEIVGSESQRRRRQAGNIVLGLRKTRNAQKCTVFYEGIKMYNSFLPLRMKQCDRLKIFKRELKEYIFEYNIFSYIDRFNN